MQCFGHPQSRQVLAAPRHLPTPEAINREVPTLLKAYRAGSMDSYLWTPPLQDLGDMVRTWKIIHIAY